MSMAELTKSLVKVQATLKHAVKDSTNPHFKTRYADLGSVWDACREALQANGFAVAQVMTPAASGWVCVETRLLHVSGEQLVSSCVLPVVKSDPQAYGSAITYARRYGLAAMVGVIADDDDANAASSPRPAASAPVGRISQAIAEVKARPPAAPRATQAPSGALFPAYGSMKGKRIAGAELRNLNWYADNCRKAIDDPSKARWADKERAMLAALEAEIERQSDAHPLRGTETPNGPDDDDVPPPHTDSDAF